MSDFAGVLFPLAGRRVIDETGLTGAFEIKTAFNPQLREHVEPPTGELARPVVNLP